MFSPFLPSSLGCCHSSVGSRKRSWLTVVEKTLRRFCRESADIQEAVVGELHAETLSVSDFILVWRHVSKYQHLCCIKGKIGIEF